MKKIANIIKTRLVPGIRAVMAMLVQYQIVKEIFVLSFEQGEFVLIPDELSQD